VDATPAPNPPFITWTSRAPKIKNPAISNSVSSSPNRNLSPHSIPSLITNNVTPVLHLWKKTTQQIHLSMSFWRVIFGTQRRGTFYNVQQIAVLK